MREVGKLSADEIDPNSLKLDENELKFENGEVIASDEFNKIILEWFKEMGLF